MKFTAKLASGLLVAASGAAAQTFEKFTDSNGIQFWQGTFSTTVGDGNAQWGMALPAATDTSLTNEYIGRVVVPLVTDGTWLGISHQSAMTGALLLVTWADGEDVKTSFRYASGYVAPDIYTGNATLSQISSSVNDTHYELTYRCEGCWSWDQEGATGSQVPATTASAAQLIGWAQATNPPTTPSDADSALQQHAGDGIFGALVESARNTAYTSWTSLATATAAPATPYPAGNATGAAGATGTAASSAAATATPKATAAACPTTNTLANTTWDYIIVGAGAGGIPLADKLSETGASVLLIEKGPPSSGRWGGTMKPDWLVGTNLTRFDVPGLDNEIWANSTGIACDDYSVMAGCVLGGGTAVNAGLWWRANPTDFDYNFPTGWKSADLQSAIGRVFDRIPFTDRPSSDGVLYKPQGYNIVGGALAAAGWQNVTADDVPGKKNFTFSHPDQMFSHGERGGPLATYLVTADARSNFKLVTNTSVARVVRDGSLATGVELEAFLAGGQCGTVNLTPKTGKVILSAGAFGTPKILFRSGIGPQDQLEIVQKAEGTKLIESSQWINLPVGENLDDHTNTDVVITHPNVSFYDFYGAYNSPIKADADAYLNNRTGILTQSAPNLSAVFWQEIEGDDGIVRQLQYTARVEGGHGITSNQSMVISQYLGRGKTSRGKTVINGALDMTVSKTPYINNDDDLAAIKAGIESLQAALAKDPQIKIQYPAANTTIDDWLASYPLTTSSRSANHWMGSAKMGTDSGLTNNGTSVVDTNAKVYGTDNIFIVDASIFPGMVSTNPSALIVSVAEHASELIPKVVVKGSNAVNSTAPYGNGTATASPVYPSGTAPAYTAPISSISVAPVSSANSSSKCITEITITRTRASATATSVSAPVNVASSTAASSVEPSYSAPASSASASSAAVSPVQSSSAPSAPAGYSPPAGSSAPFPTVPANSTIAGPTGFTTLASTGYTLPTTSSELPVYSSTPGAGSGAVAEWQRCGGIGYTGSTGCADGLTCKAWNPYYSQCVSPSKL